MQEAEVLHSELHLELGHSNTRLGSVIDGKSNMELGNLPESCTAAILSLTTPKDVARMACVSRAFREATCSDVVWEALLPPHYTDILAEASNPPPMTSGKKAIYFYLCDGILLNNGTQSVWLDKATGGLCRSVGARGMSICWGQDQRYWEWSSRPGSRFADVAELKTVCWFEVTGQLGCFLPPGRYTFSWRMALNVHRYRTWNYERVKFSLETTGNDVVEIERILDNVVPRAPEQWEEDDSEGESLSEREGQNTLDRELPRDGDYFGEFEVGDFMVEKEFSSVEIRYSMSETSGSWKDGLFLDGIVIRPCNRATSNNEAREIPSEEELSKVMENERDEDVSETGEDDENIFKAGEDDENVSETGEDDEIASETEEDDEKEI